MKKLSASDKMISAFTATQLISNFLRIITGFITAKLLIPSMLGLFNGIGIILGYLPLAQIGIMNGLNRDLPYMLGKGEKNKVIDLVACAQLWFLILGLISFFILSLISIYYFIINKYELAAGFLTYAVASFFLFYNTNYLTVLFRTNKDFNHLSIINLSKSILGFISLIFILIWDYYGLCFKLFLLVFVEFILLWKWRPFPTKSIWNTNVFKQLMKTGLPIFLVGQIYALWGVLQNTLVLKIGGVENFGLFSIAIMLNGSMSVIPVSINQVVYPRMAYAYGSGEKIIDLLKIPVKSVFISSLILILSFILIWIILPSIIEIYLPRYKQGTQAALWMMLDAMLLNLSVFNNIFNVLQKQMKYLISILVGIISYLFILYILYKNYGFNLVIFPQAMIAGKIVFLIINSIQIRKFIKEDLIAA